MVFMQLLGVLDFLAGASLILSGIGIGIGKFQVYLAALLILKGLLFIKSLTSMFDIVIGIVMIISLFLSMKLLAIILGIYLLIKAFFSITAR